MTCPPHLRVAAGRWGGSLLTPVQSVCQGNFLREIFCVIGFVFVQWVFPLAMPVLMKGAYLSEPLRWADLPQRSTSFSNLQWYSWKELILEMPTTSVYLLSVEAGGPFRKAVLPWSRNHQSSRHHLLHGPSAPMHEV